MFRNSDKKLKTGEIFQQKPACQPGVSLFLVILVLSVATSVLLSLVTLSLSQIKIIWTAGDSTVAFFAADTGIEQALYNTRKQDNYANFSGEVDEASYDVLIDTSDGTVIKSTGSYHQTKRAIETTY